MSSTINQNPDRVYADEREVVPPFRFDESVARVFTNMITRSVPGYETTLHLINSVAALHAQAGTCCYDLGCSLGAATIALAEAVPASCRIVAVDKSTAMIDRCSKNLDEYRSRTHADCADIEVLAADLNDLTFEAASIIVMNYTLQFIPSSQRATLIERLAGALVSGGCLIISEKVHFEDPATTEFMRQLHESYKRQQGYSELEIAQKRTALENVLITDTEDTHHRRFQTAGLQSRVIARNLNFITLLAVKPGAQQDQ